MKKNIPAFIRLLVLACLLGCVIHKVNAGQHGTSILPESALARHYYGNNAPWFERNIPFFDCSDPELNQIYYYRWRLYKSHLKDLGRRGYIVTEFLDDVSWALKPYQSLNDATAFHIKEGRWLKDRRYVDDYINFMDSGGNDRHFSEAIAAATYASYLANGDRAFAIKNLKAMEHIYHLWKDHYDSSKGLYFIEPIYDATEYSIASIDASGGKDGFFGGTAFRPTINSFMFANARAISKLAKLAGDNHAAAVYAAKAEALRQTVEKDLWNTNFEQFMDRYKVSNKYVHYWNFIRGRELAGYVPWSFELPNHNPKYNVSWKHLLSTNDFAGPYGLRTVEPSYQYYMRQYRYDTIHGVKHPECQWNGPSWPFDTTLVLEGMANLLNDYTQNVVHADDYVRLLKQYARQHYLNGHPDLQEDYNPDTGNVIVGLPRSHHYNHSEFNNLIITGLVGLRPRADNVLEVNPLIPHNPRSTNSIAYFCLENVPYHGHNVTILYDRNGTHYHRGAGLQVYVDGKQLLKPFALGRKTVSIPKPEITAQPHPIDLAVNFAKKGFPIAQASVNNRKHDVYQAVDGRIWFWPKVRNYWSDAGTTNREDWYGLDFGRKEKISSVHLYFYADGKRFKAPTKYRVQFWKDEKWGDVSQVKTSPPKPMANGENLITFPTINTSKMRLVFSNPLPAAVALVEVKVFD